MESVIKMGFVVKGEIGTEERLLGLGDGEGVGGDGEGIVRAFRMCRGEGIGILGEGEGDKTECIE